jgi:hypothetical protein
MSIYDDLGFTQQEVDYILNHIKNGLYEGDIQEDKKILEKHFEGVTKLVQQIDKIISADVPSFYQRKHRNIKSALKVARAVIVENSSLTMTHESKRLPKTNIQRLNRTATFLKGRYEHKTGRPIAFNKEFRITENGVDGGYEELLEQVVCDINESWILTLVSRARDLYSKSS